VARPEEFPWPDEVPRREGPGRELLLPLEPIVFEVEGLPGVLGRAEPEGHGGGCEPEPVDDVSSLGGRRLGARCELQDSLLELE